MGALERHSHMSLHLVPVSQATAKDCVTRWHRHNAAPSGDVIRVGAATEDGVLVAVGMAGRPVARAYDDGTTLEVTRVSSDGTRNATSMLYAALTRAAFALGYQRIITYTQADESGASLRAAGWKVIATRKARKGWNSVSRPRDDAKYMSTERTLWEAVP
jgi:hypothetical protein